MSRLTERVNMLESHNDRLRYDLKEANAEIERLRGVVNNESNRVVELLGNLEEAERWRKVNLDRACRAEDARDAALAAKEQAERERDEIRGLLTNIRIVSLPNAEERKPIEVAMAISQEIHNLRAEIADLRVERDVFADHAKDLGDAFDEAAIANAAKAAALRAAEERCEDCNDVALRAMREADAFKMRGAELDACCRAAANLLHRLDVFCGPHPAWKAEMGALRSCLDAALAQPARGVEEGG